MKRILSLLLFVFILAGCRTTEDNMDRAIAFRQELLNKAGCRFDCELTADYGEILYKFSIQCESDNMGNISFVISAPDSISGITGGISNEGGRISFDECVLGFPILSENLPTPLCAPWIFMKGLRSGYIRTCDYEKGRMVLTIADTYEEDAILMEMQFDEQEIPISCEYIWKGRRIMSMTITSFTYL